MAQGSPGDSTTLSISSGQFASLTDWRAVVDVVAAAPAGVSKVQVTWTDANGDSKYTSFYVTVL